MSPTFPRNAVGVAVLVLLRRGRAGASPLPEVTVTGNPLGATDLIAPTTSLSGDTLLLRSQSTLGETLNGLPGVSSTYFGPNASRPDRSAARTATASASCRTAAPRPTPRR